MTSRVSPWFSWARKIRMLSSVALTTSRREIKTPEQTIELAFRHRDEALQHQRPRNLISRLWAVEGLVFRYCSKRNIADGFLEQLPFESGPAAHCGLSMAAVTRFGFERDRLVAFLRAKSDPRFYRFAIETLGAMMAVRESDLFGRIMAMSARMGLTPTGPFEQPDQFFLGGFDASDQRLVSHGFGRLTYIKSHQLNSAVSALSRQVQIVPGAAIRGAAGAYSIVNVDDLPRIIDEWQANRGPGQRAIGDGLVNTLALIDWVTGKAIDEIATQIERPSSLLDRARSISTEARRRRDGPQLVA